MRNFSVVVVIVFSILVLGSCATQQPLQQAQPTVVVIDGDAQQPAAPPAAQPPQGQGDYSSLESDSDVFAAIDESANEME